MKRRMVLLAVLTAALFSGGCAVYPYDPYYAAPVPVVVAPAPPVVVVRPYYGYRYYGGWSHGRRWHD